MIEVSGDRPEEVAAFVLEKLQQKREDIRAFTALGAYDNGKLIGGFIYTNYRQIGDSGFWSIDMHMAGEPGWLSRKTLRAFHFYPFFELKCSRVVGSVRAENDHARHIASRLGAKLDGIIRSGIAPQYDTYVYTMTRQECPWF